MEFKKAFKTLNVEKIERDILIWVFRRRHRILLFIIVVSLLFTAYFIPYLNIFVNYYLVFSTSLLLAPFILDIDPKVFFITGVFFFFLAFLLWSVSQVEEAETLAEYIYVILLSGSLKTLLSS